MNKFFTFFAIFIIFNQICAIEQKEVYSRILNIEGFNNGFTKLTKRSTEEWNGELRKNSLLYRIYCYQTDKLYGCRIVKSSYGVGIPFKKVEADPSILPYIYSFSTVKIQDEYASKIKALEKKITTAERVNQSTREFETEKSILEKNCAKRVKEQLAYIKNRYRFEKPGFSPKQGIDLAHKKLKAMLPEYDFQFYMLCGLDFTWSSSKMIMASRKQPATLETIWNCKFNGIVIGTVNIAIDIVDGSLKNIAIDRKILNTSKNDLKIKPVLTWQQAEAIGYEHFTKKDGSFGKMITGIFRTAFEDEKKQTEFVAQISTKEILELYNRYYTYDRKRSFLYYQFAGRHANEDPRRLASRWSETPESIKKDRLVYVLQFHKKTQSFLNEQYSNLFVDAITGEIVHIEQDEMIFFHPYLMEVAKLVTLEEIRKKEFCMYDYHPRKRMEKEILDQYGLQEIKAKPVIEMVGKQW